MLNRISIPGRRVKWPWRALMQGQLSSEQGEGKCKNLILRIFVINFPN